MKLPKMFRGKFLDVTEANKWSGLAEVNMTLNGIEAYLMLTSQGLSKCWFNLEYRFFLNVQSPQSK